MAKNDLAFIHLLNDAIKAIRTEATLSNEQRETLVLNSIERSCANTFQEIAEDTRLSIETVRQIVRRLESENVLGILPKTNRSRMELIYSKRKVT